MRPSILNEIIARKRREVDLLRQQSKIDQLRVEVKCGPKNAYSIIEDKRNRGEPFVIGEFKRKSPSAGWIAKDADLTEQLTGYVDRGVSAVSVLTDGLGFGGHFSDLRIAAEILQDTEVLLLCKEFIIDEIQVLIARQCGANLILLIAACLADEELNYLKTKAEALGMGVLIEVHSRDEYRRIEKFGCRLVGVNNRDLNNFKTHLNNVNYVAQVIDPSVTIIAESGISSSLDLQIAGTRAKGFLIGTALMKRPELLDGGFRQIKVIKACGVRHSFERVGELADLIGINFSDLSRRRVSSQQLDEEGVPTNAVAVFYRNSEAEIAKVLAKYPFQYVQIYADDLSDSLIKLIRSKLILAVCWQGARSMELIEQWARYAHFLILDGGNPGSGKVIETEIPADFPYPFLLAGGIDASNTDRIEQYNNCLGIDTASGIETDGRLDCSKITTICQRLNKPQHAFTQHSD